MRKILPISLVLVLIVVYQIGLFFPKKVKAVVSSCTASVTPSTVTRSTNTEFAFTINNTSSSNIVWMKVTRPSGNFTVNGPVVTGWSSTNDSASVTLTNGLLAPSGSYNFGVFASSGSTDSASANWTVQVSDDSGGASPTNCTGSLGTAISGQGADTTPPTISNLSVSDIAQTSVKITWTTNENSNSVVDYGTTDDYGSTKSDSTMTTSHSITIDSLTANTTYHYNVKSTDAAGNQAESGDNTFVSSQAATTSTTTVTKTETTTKLIEDTEKPGITFTTKFDSAFSGTPEIAGKVTDNAGVAEVEYSIDGGANWLPAQMGFRPGGLPAKSTTFSFKLLALLDGNYKIRVRATDLSGNSSLSEEKILVFDRLPPSVGSVLFSLGSQVLVPSTEGILQTVAGSDLRVTLSAIGGPTEININAKCQITNAKCLGEENSFSLTKNPDTGLWSGILSFEEPGRYTLETRSIDGAKNQTQKELNEVSVLDKGKVSDAGAGIEGASIYVYYFEHTGGQFTLWDSLAYGQENPLLTDSEGAYSLYLPTGKYYLEVETEGLGRARTEIFKLDRAQPINVNFDLEELKSIGFGPIKFTLPDIFQKPVEVEIGEIGEIREIREENLVGKEFPFFTLSGEGSSYDTFYFRGRPTVLSFVATWLPQTAQQLSILEQIGKDTKFNVVAIFPQESASKVEIYKKLGGYELLMLADPDGVLFGQLNISASPSHIFVDRRGIIEEIDVGVMGIDAILEKLL